MQGKAVASRTTSLPICPCYTVTSHVIRRAVVWVTVALISFIDPMPSRSTLLSNGFVTACRYALQFAAIIGLLPVDVVARRPSRCYYHWPEMTSRITVGRLWRRICVLPNKKSIQLLNYRQELTRFEGEEKRGPKWKVGRCIEICEWPQKTF